MGVREIVLLTLAQQVAQAAAAFCGRAAVLTSSPLGNAAYTVGAELASNLSAMAGYGLVAATAEFSATQSAEKKYVQDSATLPPIT